MAAAGAAAASGAAVSAQALPPLPFGLSPGNARAAGIARGSAFARANWAKALEFVRSIGDAKLRTDIDDLIRHPSTRYAKRYPTADSRTSLRDALVRAGLAKPDLSLTGIFPPGADGSAAPQPFWSAPGSDVASHHSYPGGLLAHELFNASMAANFERTYDAVYFDGSRAVSRDIVIAAAFYHDIMKTAVFQFNADGTLLTEAQIGETGAHHCLSGAEAIVRGRDARFVTVLLSAHAAPSLGDEAKVVTWCRAAAMIAGVDPVDFGLVAKRGDAYVLAALPPIEAFVNHLSDHGYVLSIHAVREVTPEIANIDPSVWYRHETLANHSAIALYAALTKNTLVKTLRG